MGNQRLRFRCLPARRHLQCKRGGHSIRQMANHYLHRRLQPQRRHRRTRKPNQNLRHQPDLVRNQAHQDGLHLSRMGNQRLRLRRLPAGWHLQFKCGGHFICQMANQYLHRRLQRKRRFRRTGFANQNLRHEPGLVRNQAHQDGLHLSRMGNQRLRFRCLPARRHLQCKRVGHSIRQMANHYLHRHLQRQRRRRRTRKPNQNLRHEPGLVRNQAHQDGLHLSRMGNQRLRFRCLPARRHLQCKRVGHLVRAMEKIQQLPYQG